MLTLSIQACIVGDLEKIMETLAEEEESYIMNCVDDGFGGEMNGTREHFRGRVNMLLITRRATDGLTPLHQAAWHGHTSIVKYILQQVRGRQTDKQEMAIKKAVEARNDEGSSPLHWACRQGFEEIVKMFLACGVATVRSRPTFIS